MIDIKELKPHIEHIMETTIKEVSNLLQDRYSLKLSECQKDEIRLNVYQKLGIKNVFM